MLFIVFGVGCLCINILKFINNIKHHMMRQDLKWNQTDRCSAATVADGAAVVACEWIRCIKFICIHSLARCLRNIKGSYHLGDKQKGASRIRLEESLFHLSLFYLREEIETRKTNKSINKQLLYKCWANGCIIFGILSNSRIEVNYKIRKCMNIYKWF